MGINFDKRIIYIVLGIFLVLTIVQSGKSGILDLLFTIPAVLIALTFHEFAHAYAADKLGDDTPRLQGRLNLNPLNHVDPIGLMCLIIAGFGWGKPVEINPRNFDRNYSLSKAEAIVSIAGPLMNFLLAFIFLIVYYILFNVTGVLENLSYNVYNIINIILQYIVIINIGLGVFNLIPLPPLDGSKVLMHFLPYKARQWVQDNGMMLSILFLILIVTGLSRGILTPIFQAVLTGMEWIISSIFGLFI